MIEDESAFVHEFRTEKGVPTVRYIQAMRTDLGVELGESDPSRMRGVVLLSLTGLVAVLCVIVVGYAWEMRTPVMDCRPSAGMGVPIPPDWPCYESFARYSLDGPVYEEVKCGDLRDHHEYVLDGDAHIWLNSDIEVALFDKGTVMTELTNRAAMLDRLSDRTLAIIIAACCAAAIVACAWLMYVYP